MPSRHEDPLHSEPLRSKPSRGDYALESTGLVLTTLRDIAAVSQVPFLANAATLAVSIVNTAQDIKDNKEAFRHLVTDCYNLVRTAADVCKRYREQGTELSSELVEDLTKLVSTLAEVRDYAHGKVRRGFTTRIIFRRQDLETIRRYREAVRQALDRFNLQSTIAIRQGMTQIERSSTQILEHLEATTTNNGKKRRKKKTPMRVDTGQSSTSVPEMSPVGRLSPGFQGTISSSSSPLPHFVAPDGTIVYNYQSGTTTTTTISNSNNNYSNNVYHITSPTTNINPMGFKNPNVGPQWRPY